ncbi:CsbD family protein [Nocardia sp. XZ_19_385]|uniref:CsbD family protein n=1 Tax=Nocardia sp. XZ_19_385 TaxID=2769488 RepID=UPI00188E6CB9|nr:CsbD family protein [Nocardia sp. XZ_19_385]
MSLRDKIDEAGGKAKEAAGHATGDKGLRQEGKADQAEAKVKGVLHDAAEGAKEGLDEVKNTLGGLADKAKDAMHRNPDK